MTQSGNTRKVAEAAYGALEGPKDLKNMKAVKDLDGYDLVLVGFPVVGAGAPGRVRRFLRKAEGKRVALMVTHGMPSGMDEFAPVLPKCQGAAEGCRLVGTYESQGALASWMPKVLRLHPYKYVRRWARSGGEDHGVGHPNEEDLARARTFAREMAAKSASNAKGRE